MILMPVTKYLNNFNLYYLDKILYYNILDNQLLHD